MIFFADRIKHSLGTITIGVIIRDTYHKIPILVLREASMNELREYAINEHNATEEEFSRNYGDGSGWHFYAGLTD